jgi:hypothetical protein
MAQTQVRSEQCATVETKNFLPLGLWAPSSPHSSEKGTGHPTEKIMN